MGHDSLNNRGPGAFDTTGGRDEAHGVCCRSTRRRRRERRAPPSRRQGMRMVASGCSSPITHGLVSSRPRQDKRLRSRNYAIKVAPFDRNASRTPSLSLWVSVLCIHDCIRVDDASDALYQLVDVDVDHESHRQSCQLQIGQQLCCLVLQTSRIGRLEQARADNAMDSYSCRDDVACLVVERSLNQQTCSSTWDDML